MVRAGIIGCQEVMKSGCVGSEACTNCYKAEASLKSYHCGIMEKDKVTKIPLIIKIYKR